MSYARTVSATVTGILIFCAAVLGAAYYQWGREPGVKKGSILLVRLQGMPVCRGIHHRLLFRKRPLHTVLDNLSKAAVDRR
jgi:hypothetical protein